VPVALGGLRVRVPIHSWIARSGAPATVICVPNVWHPIAGGQAELRPSSEKGAVPVGQHGWSIWTCGDADMGTWEPQDG
jgi:hypothetical protein